MKNLAIFCGSLSHGGAERVSIYLAEHLLIYDVVTTLITRTVSQTEYSVPNGVRRLNVHDYSNNSIIGLRKAIIISGADIVLVMGASNSIYAVPACLGLNVKLVISERNSPQNFAGRKIVRLLSEFLMRKAAGFVFQTEGAKKYYDKMLKGRGKVIPNPLITNNLPAQFHGQREKRIVSVGRLVAQKNHELLIKAFAAVHPMYPDYTLEIYGDGPLKEKLFQLVDDMNLAGCVILRGNVNDVFKHTINAAVFVMSSNFEGMPNALIEAMALGLPCISTDCPCGGPRFLINHGKNGLLCEVNDEEGLKKAIITMLEKPERANQMGGEAVKVRDVLDANKIVAEWYNYMNSL